MTFEQDVRAAIFGIIEPHDGDDCASWISDMLAPRVAAAIQKAAARGVNLGVMEPALPNGLQAAREVALAALRGTLGETP